MHEENGEVGRRGRLAPGLACEVLAILVCLFLVAVFWPAAVYQVLHASGFFRRVYGEEMASLAWSEPERQEEERLTLAVLAGPGAADAALPMLRRWAFYRLNLWAMVLACPFQVATIPLLLNRVSGIRPTQLGLTTRHLHLNVLAGVAGALILTPAVLGVNWAVERLYEAAGAGVVQQHPLTLVAQQGPSSAEWVLLFLTGMVTAPAVEELMFRGMLQPWFASRRWGGHAAMAASIAIALWPCWGRARAAWSLGVGPLLEQAAPAVFILALVPVYLAVWWRSRTPAGPAIFGTAVLFASVHSSVWPSPVALLLLALGLGGLAWYTRSLVGPFVLHGLFNGVSCVMLLLG